MRQRRAVRLFAVIACVLPVLVATTHASAQEAEPAPRSTAGTEADAPSSGDAPRDQGLGLEWVWLNADVGFSYMDLKSADLAISPAGGTPITIVDTTSAGATYGFGAGIRLLFLTLGLRARNHAAMNLWQIDGEVGLHGRVGRLDPYFAARFGYDTVGTLGQSVQVVGSRVPPPDLAVHGWNGGLALGFDYYFAHAISLGVEAAGDVVYLKRQPATPPSLTPQQQAAIDADPAARAQYQKLLDAYQASASSVGFGGAVTAHVGVHF